MGLKQYNQKRNFSKTPEPSGKRPPAKHKLPIFVVQEHHASTHHFDFRIEAEGVLKSWAVPKGPSMSPADKRLAVQVEDHPLSYATFHGDIPEGSYGAGHVEVWDHGTYEPADASSKTVPEALDKGRLSITLHGRKLKGTFSLVRTRPTARQPQWLLIKRTDQYAKKDPTPDPRKPAPRRSAAAGSPPSPSPRTRGEGRGEGSPALNVERSTLNVQRSKPPTVHVSRSSYQAVTLTHPTKLLYPEVNLTKQDIADYYRRISHLILPYLHNRPISVERYPAGVGPRAPRFWQKNLPKESPSWIPRVTLPSEEGKPVQYALINDLDTLLWFVNQNALSYHIYLSTIDDLSRPDFILFDLDPGKRPFKDLIPLAKSLHQLLDARNVPNFLKTSGKSGLHILAKPTDPSVGSSYDTARAFAESIATELVKKHPTFATTERSIPKRKGRVYIDYMQNHLGHHMVAPYSLRPTPTATVSTPLPWSSLTAKLDPTAFTAQSLPKRLSSTPDPMLPLLKPAD